MPRTSVKSINIALTAIGVAASALATVAVMLGAPGQMLDQAYDTALSRSAIAKPAASIAAHGVGSEWFWLTRDAEPHNGAVPLRTLALGDRFSLDDRAISTKLGHGTLEVVEVEEIAHAGRLASGLSAPRLLLITARTVTPPDKSSFNFSADPGPVVRFVIDAADVSHGLKRVERAL